ncbi:MAG: response regulator [Pseudomonadales bacterium]|nr:response regulator [Pseudomonadales bacterium]
MSYFLKLLLAITACISLTGFANTAFSNQQPLAVDSFRVPFNLAPKGYYLIDSKGEYNISAVRSEGFNARWEPHTDEIPNFGFTDDVVWAYYLIQPRDEGFAQGVVEVGYPLLDDLEIFVFENDLQLAHYKLGDTKTFDARPVQHQNFVIPVSFKKDSIYAVCLRVDTASSVQFPVVLWDQMRFWEADARNTLGQVVYLGAMAIMVLYNLVLFFYLRERAYIYYVALVLGAIGFQSGIDGLAFQRFFPDYPLLQEKIVSVSIAIQILMATLFAKNFLAINNARKKLNDWVNAIAVLNGLLLLATCLLPYVLIIQPVAISAAVNSTFWLVIGIQEWRRGNYSAKLFVLAWISFVIGVVILVLNKYAILPRSYFTENATVIGTLAQVVLFSLALASRIDQERNEKAKATKDALLANQKAVENLRKFQDLYEDSVDGMFKCNQKGEFLHANPAMAKMLNFPDVKSLMQSKFSVKEDMFANGDELNELFKKLRDLGSVREFDAELRSRYGDNFWGSLSIRMLQDEQGKRRYFEGSLRDITVRREKEKAELERKAADEATQAKSYFLANMSHEIRTPLTAIIGFAESVQAGGLSEQEERSYVGTIIRNSQHLLHVINEILDLSKIEAKKLETEVIQINLFSALHEVQSTCEMKARDKGLDFNIVYEFPLPRYIYSDLTRLKQILLNLTSNALKFTEKGSITITVFYKKEKHQIGFRVADTGIGMTQGQQERVFEAFTQADSSTTRLHGGTGLGLSIAKQLAELMGGHIIVCSELDVGSTFELLVDSGEIAEGEWIHDISEAGVQKDVTNDIVVVPKLTGNILYAEDNQDNQNLISMLVKPTGASLKVVDNGAEAMAEALRQEYDLILMDIQMPMMSGTTATRLLRENGYQNPIVAITANLMDYEIKEYLSIGCNGYLAKPVHKNRFYEVLSLYLASTTPEIEQPGGLSKDQYTGSVLVADDLPDNRALFSSKLKKYGLSVVAVEDGQKAVEKALIKEFDLILMDLKMPNMGGEDAVRLLRSAGYQNPIVALTAEDDSATVQRLLTNGFNAHLIKPLIEEELVSVFKEYLPSKRLTAEASSDDEAANEIFADPEFRALVDNYVAGLGNYVTKLDDAKNKSQWNDLQGLAHQLKGSGGSFGFQEISDAARELELALKENRLEVVPDKFEQLMYEIGAVCSRNLDSPLGNIG